MDDVFVYCVPLPGKIREIVTPCADGHTIYIDSNLSDEQKIHEYEHAMSHIRNNDFAAGGDVQEIENKRHSE